MGVEWSGGGGGEGAAARPTHGMWRVGCSCGPAPWSLASFDLRLYVCDEGAVRMINLTAAVAPPCQLSMAVLDPRGVAAVASPTAQGKHHVLVTDGASHKLCLFEVDSLGGCSLLATWGSGASRNLDGPIADAAFQEPWGVAPYCGTWYVACYGGKEGGSICVVTPVTFAVKICELIEASPTMPSAMSHHGSSVRKLRVQGQRARRLVCMRSSRRCVCSLHHHLLISHACLSQHGC